MNIRWLAVVAGGNGYELPPWGVALFVAFCLLVGILAFIRESRDRRR